MLSNWNPASGAVPADIPPIAAVCGVMALSINVIAAVFPCPAVAGTDVSSRMTAAMYICLCVMSIISLQNLSGILCPGLLS